MAAGIDTVDPLAIVAVGLAGLVAFGALAVVVAWRNYSDNKAAQAGQQRQLPAELPRNFSGGWDRLDERGRPW